MKIEPDPRQRVYRTILQVVLAVLAAIPAAVALIDIPATTAAKVTGIAGAAAIIASAVHNTINARQTTSTNG